MTIPQGLILFAALVACGFLYVVSHYFLLWLRALASGAHVGMFSLILMSLRKVDPKVIVECKVMGVQAGLPPLSTDAMESQYLAGGNVRRIVLALITADRSGVQLDWNTAAAIDLAGRDILEAVRVCVTPKVIHCPQPDNVLSKTINGVAKDGIQLNVQVLVTVRTAISQLIGGSTEATIIARVGEGIVSAIGSCETYQAALSDPMLISRRVESRGLDAQTSFSIVSIDIGDIDVGENIGAKIRLDQADADIRIARALAEKRRTEAVATTQEMIALTRENQANLILAEAQIPVAIGEAYRSGQLRTGVSRGARKNRLPNVKSSSDRAKHSPDSRPETEAPRRVENPEPEGGG
ncbi:MAG: flotillin-like FloA family protein [Planctomycetaceae bacterium]